jgi:hypothetical protein
MLGGHPASGNMTLYDGYIKAKNNERKKEYKKGNKLNERKRQEKGKR